MPAKILDGKKTAEKIVKEIWQRVKTMKIKPGLVFVLVGNNPASKVYIENKDKACKNAGFYTETLKLPETIAESELLRKITQLNNNPKIHGMIVQLPLPKHIDEKLIIDSIWPHKDADGFSPMNLGNMLINNNMILPATPKGIIRLLDEYKIKTEGKHAVVVGRSNIVGKPVSILLLNKGATVSICHSQTKNLAAMTKQADILVVAAGKPKLIKANMVKKGAVVVDVGINREKGRIIGDVDFDNVKKVASYITPVPGGIGPMTIAMLLENTLECMNVIKIR